MQVRLAAWSTLPETERKRILARSETDITAVLSPVRDIIERVRTEGDRALAALTLQFDGADISSLPFRVADQEFVDAEASLSPGVTDAIRDCAARVRRYHEGQLPGSMSFDEVQPGVWAGGARQAGIVGWPVRAARQRKLPLIHLHDGGTGSRGRRAPVVVVTPPDHQGRCDPATLFAARLSGAHEVYRVGGVQALAALAYGTASIRPVDKFLGPGSQFVTAAKRILAGVVDVGINYGPSESMILADESADPRLAALDLLIEAEHGPDSQALLVTASEPLARAVAALLPGLAARLPEPRRTFVTKVFEGYGGILIARSAEEAVEIVDAVAPEHLQIATRDPLATLSTVHHAGEILLGQSTPFSLANYAVGANAVLPTGGRARTASPLSVRDFMKYSSVVYLTHGGHAALRDSAITLADYEGFPAHAMALRERSSNGNQAT